LKIKEDQETWKSQRLKMLLPIAEQDFQSETGTARLCSQANKNAACLNVSTRPAFSKSRHLRITSWPWDSINTTVTGHNDSGPAGSQKQAASSSSLADHFPAGKNARCLNVSIAAAVSTRE
jgi:hypothetical protein